MEKCILPRELSFSHNGKAIVAVLINDPPGGGWTSEENCSICKQPLGNHSFYSTDPLLFYIHAHCAKASLSAEQSRSLSAEQSRRIPYFPSAPPPNPISYPSPYNYNYPPPPPYNYNYSHTPYNQFPHPPPPPPYNYSHTPYNQFPHPPPPSPYNYSHTPYNQFPHPPPPPPPSSSVPVWTGLAVTTVVGSLLQALFSSIFST